ncbi:MAG TPA: hypothetical protein VK069_04985, partial [Mycolicibacillus parakoreensis]|nr:hypothetical protein [Mycolicibacillus parakoreensis]
TLGSNAASYGGVETANAAEAGLLDGGGSSGLLGLFTGGGTYGTVTSTLSNSAMVGVMQVSNFGSAASIFSAINPDAVSAEFETGTGEVLGGEGGALAAAPSTTGAPGAATAAPVSAATGQSASAGRLSVPASWGTTAPTAANPANALAGARAGAAPAEMPYAGVPGGLPAAAAGGDHHGPTGATKYAVKPKLTPRPPAV